MKLFSCFWGRGARQESPNISLGPNLARNEDELGPGGTCVAACYTEPLPTATQTLRTAEDSVDCQGGDIAMSKEATERSGGPSMEQVAYTNADQGSSSLAAELLHGLSFTQDVLGCGSFGIVVKGTLDGADVAVKFIVTSKPADRAVVREVTVGPSQALTHPHICKTHTTRTLVLTREIMAQLHRHTLEARDRYVRHKLRLLLPASPAPAPAASQAASGVPAQATTGVTQPAQRQQQQGKQQQGAAAAAAAAAAAHSPHRLHLNDPLLFLPNSRGMFPARAPYSTLIAPLLPGASSSPVAVLHEVLGRLGAYPGQAVTLVVMEYCCKGTLSNAIHKGAFAACALWSRRIAARALVRTAAELARSLLHLHRGGVVHGDLKPGNVLLKASREDRRGFCVKLGDFGLSHVLPYGAKSLDTDTWGTPAYMAPEALAGRVGKASDVWSFGVILSEAMTRKFPYGEGIEPDRLVLGIMGGKLQLAWPKVAVASPTVKATSTTGITATCTGGAKYDAIASAINLNSDAADGLSTAAVNIAIGRAVNTGDVTATTAVAVTPRAGRQPHPFWPDSGVQTQLTNTVTSPGTEATNFTLLTTTATTTDNATTATNNVVSCVAAAAAEHRLHYGGGAAIEGWDASGAAAAAAGSAAALYYNRYAAAAAGGGNGGDEELDAVDACLVNLGRRCTNPVAADRPDFAEILGELIDLELVLKGAPKQGQQSAGGGGIGSGGGGEKKDSGGRARSRLCFAAAAAAQLRQSINRDGRTAAAAEGGGGGQLPAAAAALTSAAAAAAAVARAEAAVGPF